VMMPVMQRNRHVGPDKGQQRKNGGKTARHRSQSGQTEESTYPF
jgi:hypothetical protein